MRRRTPVGLATLLTELTAANVGAADAAGREGHNVVDRYQDANSTTAIPAAALSTCAEHAWPIRGPQHARRRHLTALRSSARDRSSQSRRDVQPEGRLRRRQDQPVLEKALCGLQLKDPAALADMLADDT